MGRRFFPSDASVEKTAKRLLGPGGRERFAEKRRAYQKLRREALGRPSRSPRRSRQQAGPPAQKVTPTLPSMAHLAHTKMGFGSRPGDRGAFNALGSTGTERLENYIEQQLAPGQIDDSACDALINSGNFVSLNKNFSELYEDHALDDEDWENYIRPYTETELLTCLRALHSKRQLKELITGFWHDHFNVHGEEAGPMFHHYDRTVIRPNVFGNFRTMLEGVVKHPVMLEYLDNKYNTYVDWLPNNGINENFARELLELHTLGAENFYGSLPPGQVPTDGNGVPLGYTDHDVTMAARCLTGWTVSDQPWYDELPNNTGEFAYVHTWHDRETNKQILGQNLTGKNTPMSEGTQLLDSLANHRGTATFIARKLCRRLVSDTPSENLVQSVANVFWANRASNQQIRKTLRYILNSDEFRNSFGKKVKRPFEAIISSMRAGNGSFTWRYDQYYRGLLWWIHLTGNLPFGWAPPNGYPDVKEAWISSSPRVMTWDVCSWVSWPYDWDGVQPLHVDAFAQMPADKTTAREIVDFWVARILGTMPAYEKDVLMDFMANGGSPDAELQFDEEWQDKGRVWHVLALIFQSPSFLWR